MTRYLFKADSEKYDYKFYVYLAYLPSNGEIASNLKSSLDYYPKLNFINGKLVLTPLNNFMVLYENIFLNILNFKWF